MNRGRAVVPAQNRGPFPDAACRRAGAARGFHFHRRAVTVRRARPCTGHSSAGRRRTRKASLAPRVVEDSRSANGNPVTSQRGPTKMSPSPPAAVVERAFYLYAIMKDGPNHHATKKLFRTAVPNFIFDYTRVPFRPF